MSIEVETAETAATDEYQHYRSLSTAAVAGSIVGLLSFLAIFDWSLVALPLIGVVVSTYALRKIASRPDELTGAKPARLGLLLSLGFLVVGPAWLTWSYLHEVPEGYERITYAELQPNEAVAGQVVPPGAMDLEGKRVFIKGYIMPGAQAHGIKKFLLVRDQGECCFGGNPKITDRIQVTLVDPLRLNFESRMHRVAGTFHVEPQQQAVGGVKGGVFYHLTADHLE